VLKGLQAGAEYNGKSGVVEGVLTAAGRQSVRLDGLDKHLLLKPANMGPEDRALVSLSVKECLQVLRAKNVSAQSQQQGMDKAQLQELVQGHVAPGESLAVLVAVGMNGLGGTPAAKVALPSKAPAPAAKPAAALAPPSVTEEQLRKGAESMAAMDPAAMRSQAAMLRSMDPSSVRRMNPQMANMTDAQIKEAADQMEMMAGNPEMMKMAAEQMRSMTPAQLEEMKKMAGGGDGGGIGGGGGGGGGMPTMNQAITDMDTKQLKTAVSMVCCTACNNARLYRRFFLIFPLWLPLYVLLFPR